MKMVVLDGRGLNPGDLSWDKLGELGDLTVYDYSAPEEVVERIGDAPVIFTNKTVITAALLDACPQVKYIGVLATGYNVVDIAACNARGVTVCNVPVYGTDVVAQFVFALLLEIAHRVGAHNQAVQDGRWITSRDFCFWDYPTMELMGKTIGIIGYGRIGHATAKLARAFGMKVLACSPHGNEPEQVDLDTLLRESDVISLHCRLTPENTGLINRDTIAKMKDGVIIINTARGPLINEADLREALLSGKVYAAALDVLSAEPMRADNPLLGIPNCIITPHIAWAARESRQRLLDTVIDNVKGYMEGKPQNTVRA